MPSNQERNPSRAGRLATAFAVMALQGCADGGMNDGACTAMFASIPVTVVDAAGQPVENATVTAVLVRTGETLVPTSLMLFAAGTYPLVDDGSSGLIRRTGDAVQAHIANGAQSRTVDYIFSVPGGCHVSKVSGPDTVTLQ
jgi:hypothetical protein